ncbi:MAG: hypothetical protein A2Z08_03900 [Deltaproteobacteria bacterium RBG_16_54_11]|nr:MAG: hypothetical protein A2Z08_03900 [Deltaproteobacteria bacterium RBG_16_54_11]
MYDLLFIEVKDNRPLKTNKTSSEAAYRYLDVDKDKLVACILSETGRAFFRNQAIVFLKKVLNASL